MFREVPAIRADGSASPRRTERSTWFPLTVPPQEIKAAVMQVVETNLGGHRDQVAHAVLKLLGFKSSSAQLRAVVQSAIYALVIYGALIQQGENLVAVKAESAGDAHA